jgi:hypothetical protein
MYAFSAATEFSIAHKLLRKAGMPENQRDVWLPYLPHGMRDWWSVAPDPTAARRDFATELMQAYQAGMPADLCLKALDAGIMPTDSLLLWQTGRSHDTFQMVQKANVTMRLHRNTAEVNDEVIGALLEVSHAEVREWMESAVPRERILLYIRSGMSPTEALTISEPNLAAGGNLADVETLAALFPLSADEEEADTEPDPIIRH